MRPNGFFKYGLWGEGLFSKTYKRWGKMLTPWAAEGGGEQGKEQGAQKGKLRKKRKKPRVKVEGILETRFKGGNTRE